MLGAGGRKCMDTHLQQQIEGGCRKTFNMKNLSLAVSCISYVTQFRVANICNDEIK